MMEWNKIDTEIDQRAWDKAKAEIAGDQPIPRELVRRILERAQEIKEETK
jgi:hypothetical protein